MEAWIGAERGAWRSGKGLALAGVLLSMLVLGLGPCERQPGTGVLPACTDPEDCRLWEAGRVAGVRFGFHDESGAGGPDGELAAREGNGFTNHGVSWAAFQPTPESVTESMDAACSFAEANDLFQVGFLGGNDAHQLAPKHDGDAVAQGKDLFQILRYQQYGGSALAFLQQLLPDVFGGSYVQAAGRVGGDQQSR